MALPLPQYAKAKDNYCIAYYGNNKEHLVQLRLLRPFMESTFPGIKVYLACREDAAYLFKGEERIFTSEELKTNKHLLAYIRELTCDMQSHPVEEFMNESAIPCGPIRKEALSSPRCPVLLTNGISPVRSLNGKQIQEAIRYIRRIGGEPSINSPWESADWVIGVENEQLYEAAAAGKYVTLIPTGFGENLFNKMFPAGQILTLPA
jgi:hypothetical protein